MALPLPPTRPVTELMRLAEEATGKRLRIEVTRSIAHAGQWNAWVCKAGRIDAMADGNSPYNAVRAALKNLIMAHGYGRVFGDAGRDKYDLVYTGERGSGVTIVPANWADTSPPSFSHKEHIRQKGARKVREG